MLDETTFAAAAAQLCAADPDLAAIVELHGLPEFWAREPGLETLVLLILEQQVSLASARAALREPVPAALAGWFELNRTVICESLSKLGSRCGSE